MLSTKKLFMSSALFSSLLFAGGDIAPVGPIVETPMVETSAWSFELSPYASLSSISGDSGIGRAGVSEIAVNFGQISDVLKFGTAVHFEALHNSEWGLWLDYNYVSLGGGQPSPTGLGDINIDIKQAVFEGLGVYRQMLQNGTFDYMAGVRSWRMKFSIDAPLGNKIVDERWVDFVVGARWTTQLSENWKFMLRGDVGTGDSDFTATAATGFRYTINEWLDFDIQYKALWVDYETGTEGTQGHFKYDTVTYGPIIGLNFKF